MEETPYQKGYKHGRNGKKSSPDTFQVLNDKIAYIHGHALGSKDRAKDNVE